MEVTYKIRDIRAAKGLSQEYMATKLELSQRAYSKIEMGQTQLNWSKLNSIAEVLNIGVWELVDTDKEYTPIEQQANVGLNLLDELINGYEQKIEKLETEVALLKEAQLVS